MRGFPGSQSRRVVNTLVLLSLLFGPQQAAAAGDEPRAVWAGLGVGLAPSPYNLDGNGSPNVEIVVGRAFASRAAITASLSWFTFGGTRPARFTPLAVGGRIYLSEKHRESGGPYAGASALLCEARFDEPDGRSSRVKPGFEWGVGTEVRFSSALALDWNASYVIVPASRGFNPNPVTHDTNRDGLRRGVMRLRFLVLR